jgi:hypothetical protein
MDRSRREAMRAVRLFVFAGPLIASFWSEERCRETFGAGDYREGWFLLDDDAVELDDPIGWEPVVPEIPSGADWRYEAESAHH